MYGVHFKDPTINSVSVLRDLRYGLDSKNETINYVNLNFKLWSLF